MSVEIPFKPLLGDLHRQGIKAVEAWIEGVNIRAEWIYIAVMLVDEPRIKIAVCDVRETVKPYANVYAAKRAKSGNVIIRLAIALHQYRKHYGITPRKPRNEVF